MSIIKRQPPPVPHITALDWDRAKGRLEEYLLWLRDSYKTTQDISTQLDTDASLIDDLFVMDWLM